MTYIPILFMVTIDIYLLVSRFQELTDINVIVICIDILYIYIYMASIYIYTIMNAATIWYLCATFVAVVPYVVSCYIELVLIP